MLRSTNPTIVPSDHFLANIAITSRHTKKLPMIIGRNASVFPKFAPTNVLPIRSSVDFFNTISKSNVFCKKFHVNSHLVVAKQQWRGNQCNKDVHLKMTASKCKDLEAKLTDTTLALAKMATQPVFNPPPDIIMNEFERRKKESEHWYSPAFYIHVGSYKMCLNITANGWGTGEGTHVSVGVWMMKGEFDSHLKWPFKGEITVELVNQKEGGKNYEMKPVKHTDSEELDKVFQRVIKGERATGGWGSPQFISHADLYKPEKGKEYLLNDTLIFRVTKVEVTSV